MLVSSTRAFRMRWKCQNAVPNSLETCRERTSDGCHVRRRDPPRPGRVARAPATDARAHLFALNKQAGGPIEMASHACKNRGALQVLPSSLPLQLELPKQTRSDHHSRFGSVPPTPVRPLVRSWDQSNRALHALTPTRTRPFLPRPQNMVGRVVWSRVRRPHLQVGPAAQQQQQAGNQVARRTPRASMATTNAWAASRPLSAETA